MTEVKRHQITLGGALLILVVVAVLLALLLPMHWKARLEENERYAYARLKMIATAEADFRGQDRDGNLVADFWTADVFGLYGLVPITASATGAGLRGDVQNPSTAIRLIEPSVAAADGLSRTSLYDNVTFAASIVSGSANHGYVFRAFASQHDGAGPTTLLNDTDGNWPYDPGMELFYGDVHDRSRFAFMAFPTSLSEGRLLFIVNSDNTIWRLHLPREYRATYRPLGPGESSSRVTGTGQPGFDMTESPSGVYPSSPGGPGRCKPD